jgi:hypothetical protein
MDTEQFLNEIMDREPDVDRLPVTRWYAWHPRRTAAEVALLLPNIEARQDITPEQKAREAQPLIDSLNPTLFELNKACPLDETVRVYAIFRDADSIRIYCAKAGGAQPDKPRPPMRFTLSHTGPQFTIEFFPAADVWLDQIADEFDTVAQTTATYDDADLKVEAPPASSPQPITTAPAVVEETSP